MEQSKNINEFSTLLIYFFNNFSHELLLDKEKPKNKKEEIVLEIFNRVNDIYTIFYRLNKYPFYFESLYIKNNDNITEAETLEYHIQNYLNDFYSLGAKIERVLNFIKNNMREFSFDNNQKIKELIEHIKNNTIRGLEKVKNARGEHMHDMSVRDPKISEAKLLLQTLGFIKINNLDYSDKEKMNSKYKDLIKESKDKYIQQSENNCSEMKKLSKFFVSRFGFLISTLFGHTGDEFKKMLVD